MQLNNIWLYQVRTGTREILCSPPDTVISLGYWAKKESNCIYVLGPDGTIVRPMLSHAFLINSSKRPKEYDVIATCSRSIQIDVANYEIRDFLATTEEMYV